MRNVIYIQNKIAILEAYENETCKKHKVVFDVSFLPYVLAGNPNATYQVETEVIKYKNQFKENKEKRIKGIFKKEGVGGKKVYLKDIILDPDENEKVHTIDNPLNLTLDNLLLIREA